jgi:hypothetical protein
MRLRMNMSRAGHWCRRNDRRWLSCNGRGLQELIDFLFDPSLPGDHEEVHQHDSKHQAAGSDQPTPERRKPPDHTTAAVARFKGYPSSPSSPRGAEIRGVNFRSRICREEAGYSSPALEASAALSSSCPRAARTIAMNRNHPVMCWDGKDVI